MSPRGTPVAAIALILLVSCRASTPSSNPSGGSKTAKGGSSQTSGGGGIVRKSEQSSSSYDDAGVLGSMAKTFLRSSPATSLLVEVDWVKGRDPDQSALDHLRDVLTKVADKPGGITVARGNEIASSISSYTVADIQAIERKNRNRHSAGTRATMWIVYLNGTYKDGGALGLSWDATSAAIFRDTIDQATTAIVLEASIERAVITHEVGHLLSLINIGWHSPRNHEDAAHPHHSSNSGSVMYWAVEDVSIKNLLTGGPPSDFDSDDLADLQMLKAS